MSASIPANEDRRLEALRDYEVLDTDPEPLFDRLARTAQFIFDVPISAVSLLDQDRQFFKSRIGLDVLETPRDVSFCAHAILQSEPFVVCDATADERFARNPFVIGAPNIRFYAGVPLAVPGGLRLGTLCVIDTKSRPYPSAGQLSALKDLADEAVEMLEARKTAKEKSRLSTDLSTAREKYLIHSRHRLKMQETAALALEAGRMGHWEWDAESNALAWSDNLFDIMGFSGRLVPPSPKEWLRRIHSQDRSDILRFLRNKTDANQSLSLKFRLRHPKLGERHITAVGRFHFDPDSSSETILSVVWDSTEEYQRERALRESEELFRTLSESSPIGIFRWDARGETTYVNHRLGEIFGVPSEALLKKNWRSFIHPDDLSLILKHASKEAANSGPVEHRIIRSDGTVRWVCGWLTVLYDSEGKPDGRVGTIDDITERKNTLLELQAANRSKDQFLANVSHELRTPLNGVLGMTDLLLETSLSEDQREMADIVLESSKTLLAVITDLLDASHIQAGKLVVEYVPFQWSQMMRELLAPFEDQAARKGLFLRLSQSPNVAPYFVGDAGRIKQILTAFLNNALKFTRTGGITVEVIADDCDRMMSKLLIAVRDTGPGISQEDQARLFRPFAQLDPSSTRQYGGAGLGLTIASRIAELIGGTVGILSSPDEGSTFWLRLTLPVHWATDSLNTEPEPALSHAEQGRRILVVEDDLPSQAVALNVLSRLGWQADVAQDGRTALDLVRANNYAMVLMDCRLPELDGYTVTQEIRRWEKNLQRTPLPIVALTAQARDCDRERCLQAGMNDYLSKPFALEELRKALGRWTTGAVRRSPAAVC